MTKINKVYVTNPENLPYLSSEIIACKGKAAALCLEKQGFHPGVNLDITGSIENSIQVFWENLTEKDFSSFNDLQEATEWGAEAIAFVIIRYMTNFEVIKRSRKGTGFDYHLSTNINESLFQQSAKLEVSGIFTKTKSNNIESRIKLKITQATRYSQDLSLFVVITEFSSPETGVYYAT